ncbi:MAG: glycine--tRNA ligase [Candidatus Magasanikbacteria bacterium]|nr:glycine--tRNA ligase [Candidatus Magasanikbacteria bacterium]
MSAENKAENKMDKIISLCKRRGFIFPGSEIYGGLANTWDYGPLGILLKNNIRDYWWQKIVRENNDIVGLDASILMNSKVWEVSGHVAGFTDPLVDCKACKKRWRADHLLEAKGLKPDFEPDVELVDIKCPECGGSLGAVRQFNLMFETNIGPLKDEGSKVYLRPETAQGIFVNFKNVLESQRKRVPFGIAQIGKAFRNEITPGNFVFRTREFEQMEMEWFVKPGTDEDWFETWKNFMWEWFKNLGVKEKDLRFYEHPKEKLSHYSKRTVDLEYNFPWGWGELWGLANRTDFDLKQHSKFSGQELSYRDPETNEVFVPFVIEPALGLTRALLVLLLNAYEEVETRSGNEDGKHETEIVLRLHKAIAPIKAAILPLSKKEPLAKLALEIQASLAGSMMTQYDETGSIGKRYRRQDEIGTPYCVTVDFESLEDKQVTVRDRDTMAQERVAIADLRNYLINKFL